MIGATEFFSHNPTDISLPAPMQTPLPSPMQNRLRGLYVITDAALGGGHLSMARAALDGGAQILQLRDKTTPPRPLLEIARQIRIWTREKNALFLINDRLDLALLCEADGVHLGPDDWPVLDVRRVLGEDKIIGVSTATQAEARAAKNEGANYLGVGAVFGTRTKLDAGAPIGLDHLRALALATSLPVAAIGGVNRTNIASTFEYGAQMACVISALSTQNEANPISKNLNPTKNEAKIDSENSDSTKNEGAADFGFKTQIQRDSMTQTARELVALCEAALAKP